MDPLNKTKTALFIRIKVKPGSSRTEFNSVMSDGSYKIRLKASPVDGKANAELIRWLSKQFVVSKEDVSIKTGTTSRLKILKIANPTTRPVWFNE